MGDCLHGETDATYIIERVWFEPGESGELIDRPPDYTFESRFPENERPSEGMTGLRGFLVRLRTGRLF